MHILTKHVVGLAPFYYMKYVWVHNAKKIYTVTVYTARGHLNVLQA